MALNLLQISIVSLIFFVSSFQRATGILRKSQMCEVETGQTNIILDIEESQGDFIGQETTPSELPIFGDPFTEIALELVFTKGNPIFRLQGKKLQLLQPLDRDEENLSHIVFQVSCAIRSTNKKRNIPIIVRVSDINDNAPRFMNTPYEITVPESTPVGTTVFRNIQALDKDAGINGLVEYSIIEGNSSSKEHDKITVANGYGIFAISFPHQGQVTTAKTLDYEKVQRYYVTILASDRARHTSKRLSSTTTLTINVADSDDLDPSFIYRGCVLLDGACINPEYTASVPAGSLQGVLTVLPERIQAVDLDSISSPVHYSFASGLPSNYANYFSIDEQTGVLKQIKAVDTSTAKKYDIVIKAEEVSQSKRFTTAKLSITVKPVDANPPVISASNVKGYVNENSPIGTKVLDENGKPILLKTTDADLSEDDPKPKYIYEFTTPSFSVDEEGILIINEENLDRDPPAPGQFKFQVVAREPHTNAASAPLSLVVILRDVNDNAPKLSIGQPVTIIAGDGRRLVTKVNAFDNDEGVNAEISYSIYHVSNNGLNKFEINEQTGEIETVTRLPAGEQYSITVQATDKGGLYSQAIVEVSITPGPNTKPPKFAKNIYEVQVSEGAEINSTVAVVHADDPENDPVVYSIISGNDLRQFAIGQDNGVIIIIRKLDRESLTRYQLIVKAEDNGGLSSTATINIKVTDINDKNPEFEESTLPYIFHVDEGKKNVFVGIVHATDADEGINAEIQYFLPTDIPFNINNKTGEIHTATELDFERQAEYKFVVTAKDSAPDSRLGTASVTVMVNDLPDEVPKFSDSNVEVRVPENEVNILIATVEAHDPDTTPEVTYILRKGPTDLFKVIPNTGEIRTIKGLDYETAKQHILTVGTIENDGDNPGDTISVVVKVEDRNDMRPTFINSVDSIILNDNQTIGTVLTKMSAIDNDGTPPGNVVRYELVGRGKALKYFQIDSDTGTIRLRDELHKEEDTEYQIDVRAYDLGEPQLSSVVSLSVFVNQNYRNEENSIKSMKNKDLDTKKEQFSLAFSDDSYTIDIPETAKTNVTIKTIQILNAGRPNNNRPGFVCEITRGNDLNIFNLTVENQGCGVQLLKQLDFEAQPTHTLDLHLKSKEILVNPQKSLSTLRIIVQDENDNAPEFIFESPQRKGKFYGVVNSDMDIETPILQIRATDKDSGKYGKIHYKIFDMNNKISNDDNLPSSYFTMAEDTGILRTAKLLREDLPYPMKFFVEARDNNGHALDSQRAVAHIIINYITDQSRLALAFSDVSPKELRRHQRALVGLLEEKSNGLILNVERLSNRKYLNANKSVIENSSATDMWFYLIDPKTELILKRNESILQDSLLASTVQSELISAASSIADATAEGIYAPIEVKHVHQVKAAIAINDEVFPYTLIAISIIIFVLGTIGIIYICISWSRYKYFKQRMRQYSTPSPTRYEPVIVNSQVANSEAIANFKEYETQVLAMAVPPDGDDGLQLDFSAKNHSFSLDNVSYITHKDHNNGSQTSPSSETTTATMATLCRNINLNNSSNMKSNNNNMIIMNNHQNAYNRPVEVNTRNNTNPLAGGGTFSGTLTLGRIKYQNRNHYPNPEHKLNTISRNNLAILERNTYSTLGLRGNPLAMRANSGHENVSEFSANSIEHNNQRLENNRSDMAITNPLFHRSNGNLSHISTTNDNVTFGKREYGQMGFSYLNDLDRAEVETTTEL